LGTTHLWLPADPSNGQEMVIWDVNSETVTVPALVDGQSFVMTSQGAQDIFTVSDTIKFAGSSRNILVCYDLDTGLGVGGMFSWDPIMATVGISTCHFDEVFGSNIDYSNSAVSNDGGTNIDLGPARSTINWTKYVRYAILPIAIILLIAALIITRKKKKK
jgi:hypothetical protein